MVERRSWCHWSSLQSQLVGPFRYFLLFQPVVHNWCNYPECGVLHSIIIIIIIIIGGGGGGIIIIAVVVVIIIIII